MVNYYKRFVPYLARISVPLYEMLKKNEKFKWTELRMNAFEELKKEFYNQLVLILPDFNKQFILRVDASDVAISGVLIQINDEGIEQPICFISRILKSYEVKYTISEKEMLAVVHAIQKLRFYLLGKSFVVETDHAALTSLLSTRFKNNRVYRWSLLLSEYTFEIKHIKGVLNVSADALSRMYNNKSNFQYVELNEYNRNYAEGNYEYEVILQVQRDERFDFIREQLRTKDNYKNFIMKEGLIMKVIRELSYVVVNDMYARQTMLQIHESLGHIGGYKVWLVFREAFYAKKDRVIAKDVVRNCLTCRLGKHKNRTCQYDVKSIVTQEKLELIAIDYLGNLIPGKLEYKNILVMVDVFSKFVKLFPTSQYNTDTSIQCIYSWIMHQGKMRRILADNASYFNNDRFKNALNYRNIDISFSSIRHPCGNPCERLQ